MIQLLWPWWLAALPLPWLMLRFLDGQARLW